MDSLYSYFALAWAFASAHWGAISVGLVLALSIYNKFAAGHPTWSPWPRKLLDVVIAVMPMPDSRSFLIAALASKIGNPAAAAFVGWLAQYLQLPVIDKSIPRPLPQAASVTELRPPRGPTGLALVPLLLAFLSIIAVVLGIYLLLQGRRLDAAAVLVVAGALLALIVVSLASVRRGPSVLLALAIAGAGSSGCGWWRTHEAQLEADAATCGQMLATGALEGLCQQVVQVATSAADGQLGELTVQDELHQLAGTEIAAGIRAGLKCLSIVVHDVLARPESGPTAPRPESGPMVATARRAAARPLTALAQFRLMRWLAEHPAPAADSVTQSSAARP